MDNKKQTSIITVNIKLSKTDQFRKGITVVISCAVGPLYLLVAILLCVVMRSTGKGPLFHFEDGRRLTREGFMARVWEVLQQVGID